MVQNPTLIYHSKVIRVLSPNGTSYIELVDLRLVWFWSIPSELGFSVLRGKLQKQSSLHRFPISGGFPRKSTTFLAKPRSAARKEQQPSPSGVRTVMEEASENRRGMTHPRHLYIHCITHISSPWCWNMHLPTELPERPKSPSFVGKCTSTMVRIWVIWYYMIL